MLNSTIRVGNLLFKCLGTFLYIQNFHLFVYPDRFACLIPPFALVIYCLSAWVRFYITKISMRLCTRTEMHKVTETHMTTALVVCTLFNK